MAVASTTTHCTSILLLEIFWALRLSYCPKQLSRSVHSVRGRRTVPLRAVQHPLSTSHYWHGAGGRTIHHEMTRGVDKSHRRCHRGPTQLSSICASSVSYIRRSCHVSSSTHTSHFTHRRHCDTLEVDSHIPSNQSLTTSSPLSFTQLSLVLTVTAVLSTAHCPAALFFPPSVLDGDSFPRSGICGDSRV